MMAIGRIYSMCGSRAFATKKHSTQDSVDHETSKTAGDEVRKNALENMLAIIPHFLVMWQGTL